MSCLTYTHNDPLDSGTKYISGTTCLGTTDVYNLNFGDSVCMEAELPIIICDGITISGSCNSPVVTPTPTMTSTNTPTPTITQTQTQTLGLSPTPTPTATITQTPTSTQGQSPTPTSTLTATPTPTSAPQIYTHGTVRATCSDFCNANYQIDVQTPADASYAALTIGDTIYNQGGVAGFVAYAATSTDTATGSFRIAQIDTNGEITGIFICVGGSCDPL
jgi:hypothetical protein